MSLAMTIDAQFRGMAERPGDDLWQIGQVVHELLDRYEIDLEAESHPYVPPTVVAFSDKRSTARWTTGARG